MSAAVTDAALADPRETRPAGTRPFARFEWLIASRYLRARRRETFISIIAGFSFLGILLGVATLIIVMAVMNGFRQELLGKILGVNGHIVVHPIEEPFTDFAEVAGRLEAIRGVGVAVPFVEGQVFASSASGSGGALVRGLREADLKRLGLVANNVREGSLESFEGSGGVAIGTRLATNLGVGVGDKVTLYSARGPATAMGVAPRLKAYPVAAVFELGMSEYDGILVFMPLVEAQAFFGQPEQVTAIDLYTRDPDDVESTRSQVQAAAGRPVSLTDWRQRNSTFFSALEVERNVMFLILTLIVLVAALNIVSGLTMLVKDKSRDIAVLRTIGASRGAILRVFFITGASIGVVGTIAGLALGVIVCWNIQSIQTFMSWITGQNLWDPTVRFLTEIPAVMDPGETIAVVLMALALSFLATLYPAWRAARLDPVEALRYE